MLRFCDLLQHNTSSNACMLSAASQRIVWFSLPPLSLAVASAARHSSPGSAPASRRPPARATASLCAEFHIHSRHSILRGTRNPSADRINLNYSARCQSSSAKTSSSARAYAPTAQDRRAWWISRWECSGRYRQVRACAQSAPRRRGRSHPVWPARPEDHYLRIEQSHHR